MTDFLDLLEAYHHWCVRGDRKRLDHCGAWLVTMTPVPTDDTGWRRLGTQAMSWFVPLPEGWDLRWPVLSPREMTLTAEALDYLEARRPGTIVAGFPSVQNVETSPEPVPPLWHDVSVNWALSDVLACVEREVDRREVDYPGQVRQGCLPIEQACQEIGQMRTAAIILRAMLEKGEDARQQTLF